MSTGQLEKRVRFLTIYVIAITAICGFLLITSFRQTADSRRTDELTVKRINVVAENGQLRMVISNEHRQHPGSVNGNQVEPRERPAGMLFFNELGDECGGHFTGNRNASSSCHPDHKKFFICKTKRQSSNAGRSLKVFQSSSPNRVLDQANHLRVNFSGLSL